jgi:hypothetical protein
MDAIAKDGKMVMHYVLEHVENAGVRSGDATLILPPQDLDPETVLRIEDATEPNHEPCDWWRGRSGDARGAACYRGFDRLS